MSDAEKRPVKQARSRFTKILSLTLSALLSLGALSGCGGDDQSRTSGQVETLPEDAGGSGIYDIFTEAEQIITVEKDDLKGNLTGVQFYQGEPVMLSALEKSADGKKTCDIYLYPQNGEARLIAEGLPSDARRGSGFLGEDGCYYYINGGTLGSNSAVITKYDNEGNKLFTVERKAVNLQMCSLADGRIVLFYRDAAKGSLAGSGSLDHNDILEYLDTTTGAVSEIRLTDPTEYNVWLGTDGTVPYLLDSRGVSRIDPEEGTISMQMSFSGSSYSLERDGSAMMAGIISGFQLRESGDIELLWGRRLALPLATSQKVPPGTVWLEAIQRKEVSRAKTFLTLRGIWLSYNTWLKQKTAEFNSSSDKYYVLIEDCDDGLSEDDHITRTLVELGTGKGPDILYGRMILGDSLYSLIEKGSLEELSPYMKRSGIKQEDYFPMAFDSCRDGKKLYEITVEAQIITQMVDSSLFGDTDRMDIHSYLDTLLTLGDKAVYQDNAAAADLLRSFLEGSENLWGMVDWKSGACDLDADLFAKLLQAAKNLEDNGKKSYIPISEKIKCSSFYSFVYRRSQMSSTQMFLGSPFDDGFHGKGTTPDTLVINANSPNKEGVWEFVSWLLSQEAQETLDLPVHRAAFAAVTEAEIEEKSSLPSTAGPPVTREAAAELETLLMEDVRVLPVRVQPLVDIILEEAQDYFEGTKSIEQVRAVAKNRIQLYLDEKR